MLTAADLEGMRTVQEGAMPDLCRHWRYSTALDGAGQEVVTWLQGADYACGFRPSPVTNSLNKRADLDYARTDADLRLPLSAYGQIEGQDRVQLLSRFGEAALGDSDLYEIVGEVLPGPTGIVIGLRKVSA